MDNLKERKCSFTDPQMILIAKLANNWPEENRFPALDLLSDIAGLDFKIATTILSIDNLIENLEFFSNMTRTAQIVAMLKVRCISNIISHNAAADLVIEKLTKVITKIYM